MYMDDKKSAKEKVKTLFKRKKIIFPLAIVLVIVVAVLIVMIVNPYRPQAEILSTSTLERIIDVSELSTFEAVYIGVATVMNEDKPENIDYHVYYESKVQAGIDFKQITVDIDRENTKIVVTLPEIKITDITVDIASLDYIFVNEKANTDTVVEQAYKECIDDVTNESSQEHAIYELAEQNAKNVISALVSPFIDELEEEYILEVV